MLEFTEVGIRGQICGKFCAYLLPGPLQEELSTSLKRSVYIEGRMGTSSSFDSGVAGLSSSHMTSSSQLDGMYHDWTVCQVTVETYSLAPNSCQEYKPEVST